MRSSELALRKELAVTRLRVARTEMALARTARPDKLAPIASAVDLAATLLEGREWGAWSRYARFFLRVAHIVLGVRRAL